LIQFLVTIVQPQRGGLGGSGIGKRRGQLMINDVPQTKVRKLRDVLNTIHDQDDVFFQMRKNNAGPIIRELTEELLDDMDSENEDILM
jgi:hypothetical protein